MNEAPFAALGIATCTCDCTDGYHDIDCALAPIIARHMDEAESLIAEQQRIGGE